MSVINKVLVNGNEYEVVGSDAVISSTDVKVNGVNITQNGVAEIPIASDTQLGLTKGNKDYGTMVSSYDNGAMVLFKADDRDITLRQNKYRPIVPANLNTAVISALTDENHITLTDTQKDVVNEILGVSDKIPDIQINSTSIINDGIANIPLASSTYHGVVKIQNNYGIGVNNNGELYIISPSDTMLSNRNTASTRAYYPVTIGVLDKAVKSAICDNVGEAWTQDEKIAALTRFGITVDDDGICRFQKP